jgi:hypothetical protein
VHAGVVTVSVACPTLQLERFTTALTVPIEHPHPLVEGFGLDAFSDATPEEMVPLTFQVTLNAPQGALLL